MHHCQWVANWLAVPNRKYKTRTITVPNTLRSYALIEPIGLCQMVEKLTKMEN
jgi:hypothetical protein